MNSNSSVLPEAEMIPIIECGFLDNAQNSRLNNNYTTNHEFRSQYGIADLLFYDFDKTVLDERVKMKIQPILSKEIIKSLLLIQEKKKVNISYLAENLQMDKPILKNKVIKYLTKNNYLNQSTKDLDIYWVGENYYKSCMKNIYAIEAKVSSWKRGFYQAYRYKWFSNYSFLILNEDFIVPALKNIRIFQDYNVGLMSANTSNNTMKMYHRPYKQNPFSIEIASLTYERLFSFYLEKKADSQLETS